MTTRFALCGLTSFDADRRQAGGAQFVVQPGRQRVRGHQAKKTPTWFALNDDRPLFAFAGIWRPWMGVRGTKAEHRLFSFLTCDANGIVGPVHPTAMPVLLTTREEWRTWLEALTEIALELQRPWPDSMMKVVATGARRDPAE